MATVCESLLLWGWAQGGEVPVWPAVGFPWLALGYLLGITFPWGAAGPCYVTNPSDGPAFTWTLIPPQHQPFTDHWTPMNSLPACWGSSGTTQNLCPTQALLAYVAFQAWPVPLKP